MQNTHKKVFNNNSNNVESIIYYVSFQCKYIATTLPGFLKFNLIFFYTIKNI